ncbi:arsenosugar biosynthesis radical SAM (seleno)protein ArsS [Arenicella xantha]|uniref:Radical SAM/Cys-rich protein n=1 Tax=Arenicella xantha TaxID=644221 RepID=A0A395JJX0_9GAMM|nr:arsenosugar biosynthesis radical SAM (seleno)protein ArsS [Arenicella xantha]RBP49192.1 radical SAM/Cys-rich protein [Arenicella xantha]
MNNTLQEINIRVEDGKFVPDDIDLDSQINIPTTGPHFHSVLNQHALGLTHERPQELQINLGKLCNLACHHCHVDAGPKRTEIMTWEVMQKILVWAAEANISKVDLTGGAPELNPHFRQFCTELLSMGIQITSRCNITVLFEPGQEDLAQWYADNRVRLVCSLPCYTEDNVDAQRGKGVFDKSIAGLQLLNRMGYGHDQDLSLDLVYNPGGAFLPPPQASLEQDYRQMLWDNFEITFSKLLAITNIPINRFAHALKRDGELEDYQHLLVSNFNAATVDQLMCRYLINLDWEGRVYDCDFNQMLEIPMNGGANRHLWELDVNDVPGSPIATNRHCFGCTAGAGSSCGGVLAD